MIYLNKDSSNIVILELTSVSRLLTPVYVFEFINELKPRETLVFSGVDLSTFKCRYNRFNFVVTGGTADLTASTFNLRSGNYKYNVYEATGATTSISATTGTIISTGKVYINGTDIEVDSIYR